MTALYHFTCHHKAEQIGAMLGSIQPHRQPVLLDLSLSWFTSMPGAGRAALGLTSKTLECDRMEALYEVEPDDERFVMPWADLKRLDGFAPLIDASRRLEAVRGTRPSLWWVSLQPVRARRVR